MHFPIIEAGFRLLAKCLVGTPVSSSVRHVSTTDSTTPTMAVAMQGIETVEEVGRKSVEIILKVIGTRVLGATDKTTADITAKKTDSMSTRATALQRFQPLANWNKVQVECAPKKGVLQAHAKQEIKLLTVKHPIGSTSRKVESGEVHNVLKMFEEINETECVPVFDEGDGVQTEEDPVPLDAWIDPVMEAEIALDVARCEMTVEDVDDLLTRLYIDLNRLVVLRAKNKEGRKRMAREVSVRIKEYAGVLLESQCEVRLAVERARVRSVVVKRFTPSDAKYLASLSPGSSHIPNCDESCVSSYLPHRIAENGRDGSIPELTRSEGSMCSTPSEIPSTPRASTTEPQEELEITIVSEETPAEVKSVQVVPVQSKRICMTTTNTMPKVMKVARGDKPAWKF
ncbi:unnamed protein product [Rhizoctonia solani]|uniref:Uncharacterized protein n=1 Tax=Rhizoctonia solani TaxID=456999 RepID=A0A8H3EBY8_9AGAM|nr:unnamed protein product [Rhizoctonia solani]